MEHISNFNNYINEYNSSSDDKFLELKNAIYDVLYFDRILHKSAEQFNTIYGDSRISEIQTILTEHNLTGKDVIDNCHLVVPLEDFTPVFKGWKEDTTFTLGIIARIYDKYYPDQYQYMFTLKDLDWPIILMKDRLNITNVHDIQEYLRIVTREEQYVHGINQPNVYAFGDREDYYQYVNSQQHLGTKARKQHLYDPRKHYDFKYSREKKPSLADPFIRKVAYPKGKSKDDSHIPNDVKDFIKNAKMKKNK